MSYARIKDRPGLVRDMSTNAVLSVDNQALAAYKKSKMKMKMIDELQEQSVTVQEKMKTIEDKLDRLLAILEYK